MEDSGVVPHLDRRKERRHRERLQSQRSAMLGASLVLATGTVLLAQDQKEGFRFRSGVDLINVTATVTDATVGSSAASSVTTSRSWRTASRSRSPTSTTSACPVSLGIAIDTSGSMAGEKWDAARRALDRFLYELLDPQDEVFLYRFNDSAGSLQDWTTRSGARQPGARPHQRRAAAPRCTTRWPRPCR